jgi:hypothetical protein
MSTNDRRTHLAARRRHDGSDAEVVVAFLALASGELSEEKTADWSRQRTERAAG